MPEPTARGGGAHVELGHVEEGVADLGAAIDLQPDDELLLGAAHMMRAIALDTLGRDDEAIAELRAVLRLLPPDHEMSLAATAGLAELTAPPSTTALSPTHSDDNDQERFCELIGASEAVDRLVHPNPDEVREAIGEVRKEIAERAEVAPDEIRPSVDLATAAMTQLLDLLEAANFDVAAIDQAALDAIFPDLTAAGDVILEWEDANCST